MKELIINVFDRTGELLCIIHVEGATMAQKITAIARIQLHDDVGWVTLEGSMA